MFDFSKKKNYYLSQEIQGSAPNTGGNVNSYCCLCRRLFPTKKHKKLRAFLHYVEGEGGSVRRFPHICIIVLYFLRTIWTEEQRREAVKHEKNKKEEDDCFFATNLTAVVEKW